MGGTSYSPPVQPGYGDSMREALDAQVALLTGDKVGESDFSQYKEIGGLKGITEKYEAPLRKATAQIDTDVMRQTLLGRGAGETYTADGKIITGYEGTGPQDGQYTVDQSATATYDGYSNTTGHNGMSTVTTKLIDTSTGEVVKESQSEVWIPWKDEYGEKSKGVEHPVKGGLKGLGLPEENLRNAQTELQNAYDNDFKEQLSPEQISAVTYTDRMGSLLLGQEGDVQERKPIYKADPENKHGDGFFHAPDGSFQEGAEVLVGDGMVDLVGDKRAVQEQVQNEDGTYSLQDTEDQAGFRGGEFMGLSALAEDIGRGGQQRAREADIADVERLGGRATDAYRSQGDLSGALAEARAMGAGGSEGLSAIPADPLFDGVATNSLAARTAAENANISAITGGRTGDYDPRALPPPNTSYSFQNPQGQGSAGGGGGGGGSGGGAGSGMQTQGQPLAAPMQGATQGATQGQQAQQYAQPGGTDAFRSALMQQGMGALDQGLSERENRAVQEAARARSTNMGRTFDQTASIDESRAVIEEDNARRMQNRAFAQSALGQEVGIQQADMARGLQAQQMELGRQSAGVDRQLTAEEKDIERQMRMQSMEEQYRQQGLGAERANAAQMVGLEQATSADPFQAILQRQGQNNLASGGAVFGQAGYGLNSGPQYLNPESGLGFIQNQATNAANMYGAQIGADATRSAGMMNMIGSIGGAATSAAIKKCWVAREVYGEHNPAWLLFRNWLDTDAPRWFDKLYLTFGERFANFISNKPRLKARIRMWMDTKIGR